MRDTESNLLKFAKIMERFPPLYFTSSYAELGYLWETVASTVRLEILEACTVEELRYKWKAMRAKYIAYGKKLGQGGTLRAQQQYNLYDALAFLYPLASERYPNILPPSTSCSTIDNQVQRKEKSNLKTIAIKSIRTYGNKKNTSAVDHHSVGDPDNLGNIIRSDDLEQSTRSGDSGQITEECRISIKTEALWDKTEDPTGSKTPSIKYPTIHHSVNMPDNLGPSSRSDELGLGQSTGSGDIELSTEDCSTVIKSEALWDLTEDPTSSKTSSKKYGNNKGTSAFDHHFVSEPDNLGQTTRSDVLRKKTISGDLGQSSRSGGLGQTTRSHEIGQNTGSGDIELSTEDCSTAIKSEALWDLTEDPTSSKTSSKKYGNNKGTSAFDHHFVSEPDNLGQTTRSDVLRRQTISGDLGQSSRSGDLGQTTRSHEIGQSTGSGDIGLSTEECKNAIKAEALWDLTDDPTSSDSDSDVKPNIMEGINLFNVENFPDDLTESTNFDVQETEGNLDMQFFKSILPDIVNFTPQEKRKFKMGVLKLIDEIEDERKEFSIVANS